MIFIYFYDHSLRTLTTDSSRAVSNSIKYWLKAKAKPLRDMYGWLCQLTGDPMYQSSRLP